MSEEIKENIEEKDINVNSPEYRAAYRQGYLDGMEAMADKITEKLKALNLSAKTPARKRDDGK